MRITQVELENVKSYTRARVTFTPGTNAICGHNGAGKSTLLEAIGFALFDYLPVSQAEFVREGEKLATVTIHVEERDGQRYQVVRRCGSYSQYYIYDPELDGKLAEGKQESVGWLREFLGLDGPADLPILFRDAVGVPQGLLTAAFLETPSRRKDIFNPLLRVDEYERVWEALREPERRLTQMIGDQDARVAALETQVGPLPQLQEKRTSLSAELQTDQTLKAQLDADLVEVTAHLAVLAERKDRLDELDREIAQARASLDTTGAQLRGAEEALRASETAREVVEQTAPGHQAYLAAQNALVALEKRRSERDRLQSDQQSVARDLAVAEEQHATLEKVRADIDEALATMTRLRPQVEKQKELETTLAEVRRRVQELEIAEHDLRREERQLAELQCAHEEAIAGLEVREEKAARQKDLQAELDALTEERESLVTAKAALESERTRIEEQLSAARSRLAAAEHALQQEEDRLQALTSRLEELHTRLAEAAEIEEALGRLREEIAALEDTQRELTAEAATHQTRAAEADAQLQMLSASDEPRCPVCGQDLTPDHRAKLLSDYREQAEAHRQAEAEAHAALEETTARRARKEQELSTLEAQKKGLPRPEEAEGLQEQIAEQRTRVAERREAVTTEAASLDATEQREASLQAGLDKLVPQLDRVTKAQAARLEELAKLERELAKLPRETDVESLEAKLEAQGARVVEIRERVGRLKGAYDELARVEAELDELGDPRRAYDRAASVAEQAPQVEEKRRAIQDRIEQLKRKAEALAGQLKDYADVEAELAAEREALEKHTPAHERYLAHVREAEVLASRKALAEELSAALVTADATHRELLEAREAIADEYDALLHNDLAEELRELDASLARCEERIQQREIQLAEVDRDIARLEAAHQELETAQSRRRELAETHSILTYLRSVLRSAGPEVTRALVEIISLHADRLYSDIMQTTGSRLRWTEDYDVILTTQGRERTFQQLSGGEQMAAALAVRLALLHETSTIDVAFFDEPTANLDAERRSNLAQQILNVQGFSQLFVISHDDTFEQDTDHVVRVRKENDASIIESE